MPRKKYAGLGGDELFRKTEFEFFRADKNQHDDWDGSFKKRLKTEK